MLEISKNSRGFYDLAWCAKAIAKKSERYATGCLRTELNSNGSLDVIGTDSCRLHNWHLSAKEVADLRPEELRATGFWIVRKRTKTLLWLERNLEELRFPEWRNCIPRAGDPIKVAANIEHPEVVTATLLLYGAKGPGFKDMAEKYVPVFRTDLLADALDNRSVELSWGGLYSPLLLRSGDRTALIQPTLISVNAFERG